ncbi:MAG: hypothetical protein WBN22_07710 [Verrucomicrobiia bacterium]
MLLIGEVIAPRRGFEQGFVLRVLLKCEESLQFIFDLLAGSSKAELPSLRVNERELFA